LQRHCNAFAARSYGRRKCGGIRRRARLRISKSSISKRCFLFQNEIVLLGENAFLLESRSDSRSQKGDREILKFTRLLHSGNRIDKEVWETAKMNIDPLDAEMNSLMPDWSPSAPTPFDARSKGRLDPFIRSQKAKLLQLREELTESMTAVTKGCPLSDSEASPLGTHPADAGSAVYDRDFALSLLSHEQDALHEIDQALRRIDLGTYGVCEMSGKPIPRARLEAIPSARFTVECQSQLEKENKALLLSQRVTPFALIDIEAEEQHEEKKVHENDENQLTAA
jgi:RNA polymerase-binding transcription factor DksA